MIDMYVRTKRSRNNKTVVQIAETYRIKGKSKQRVLIHVGTANNNEELNNLLRSADYLKTRLEAGKLNKINFGVEKEYASLKGNKSFLQQGEYVDLTNIQEQQRVIVGIHDIYGSIYDLLGFQNPFTSPRKREKYAKILREIVLGRIAFSASKKATVELLKDKCGVKLKLDNVYQMMDKIEDTFCERIKRCALVSALDLTKEPIKILFYDATTLYFESFTEDEFKQNGYSKDMKFNQPQVLLALFVTTHGLPISYEIFPGSMYEGHTLIPILKQLREVYCLDQIIFVADRGMLSEENLNFLENERIDFIVGARLRNMSQVMQKNILDASINRDTEEPGWTEKFSHKKDRVLIVNYNEKRAKKDRFDREKAIEKLLKKLSGNKKDPKSLLNNYGYKKYLMIEGDTNLKINKSKIEEDSKWDGLHGVITNLKDLEPEVILDHYRSLWQIEECFRINKNDLRIRPIYHWTPQRIKAHIAIAFMAFVCVKTLEYKISLQYRKMSPEQIRYVLTQVQSTVVKDVATGHTYLLPSKWTQDSKQLYRILNIKISNRIMKFTTQASN